MGLSTPWHSVQRQETDHENNAAVRAIADIPSNHESPGMVFQALSVD